MVTRAAALACVALFAASPASALTYVASDTGLEPPTWDGGRSEIAIADVNGDGHPDLVSIGDHGCPYVGTQEHGVMVWFGSGAGGWTHSANGDFGYGGVSVGDLNGDGFADIACAMHHNYSSDDFGDQLIEAALGDGTGQAWTPWDDGLATDGESYGMFGTALADLDGDGDLDLAVNSFGCCNGVHVYRNEGDGSWVPTWRSGTGNCTQDIATGDVNGDGVPDLAAAFEKVTVLLGNGAGGFTSGDANLPAGGSLGRRGPSLGDVNDDGFDDLAFAESDGGVQVWLWTTSGQWVNTSAGLPQTGPFEATQLWDMNADGEMDLVALGTGKLVIWLGDGTGAWSVESVVTLPSPGYYAALARPADVDHNGYPDLAFVIESSSLLEEAPSVAPADEAHGAVASKNHPHVLREATAAAALSVSPVAPHGGEVWPAAAVRFIEWLSAAPAALGPTSVDLELSVSGSEGPWLPIATGVPNGGRYQCNVPVQAPSAACYIRYTVHAGDSTAQVVSRRAFSIAGGPDAVGESRGGDGALTVTPSVGRGPMAIRSAPGASLAVFDLAGRRIRTLSGGPVSGWDGRDDAGRLAVGGMYLVRAVAPGGHVATARVVRSR